MADAKVTTWTGTGRAPVLDPVVEQAIRASFAAQGFLAGMGARLASLRPGEAAIEVPYGAGVTQQQGFFHGGVLGAIADSACGYAALSLMPAGSEVLTVEYKINFLRPASGRLLSAHGGVVRAGRTLTVTQAMIVTDERPADPAAIVQATMIRAPAHAAA